MHKGEPWAKFWQQKYANGWSSKNLIHLNQDIQGSTIWQAANANRQLVREHSFWEIGNGEEVNLFRYSWKQSPKIQEEVILPILQDKLIRGGIIKVKDMWNPREIASPFRKWKSQEWL